MHAGLSAGEGRRRLWVMACLPSLFLLPCGALPVFQGSLDKGGEEGVGLRGLGLELRVVLHAYEPWVVHHFHNFHEACLRVHSPNAQACSSELLAVAPIKLKTVPVAFHHGVHTVGGKGMRAWLEAAFVGTEAHGATLCSDAFLLLHDVNHGVFCARGELRAVGLVKTAGVARELDDSHLHPEAEAVVGNVLLTCVAHGENLALDAPVSKATRDKDAVEVFEGARTLPFQIFRGEADDLHATVVGDAPVDERFVNGFIGVLQVDVFANDADAYAVCGEFQFAHDVLPIVEIAWFGGDVETAHDKLVQVLACKGERKLVDGGFHITAFDDGVDGNIAIKAEFPPHVHGHRMLCATDEDVRLDADFTELGDALLRRFCLQLACRLQEGD